MLPWLAWAFGVETWDTSWTDAQKRGAIAASLAVKRMKGTIGAVVANIQSLGLDARVVEWFNQAPPGAPYTFDLVVTAEHDGFDQEQWETLLAVVHHTKNVRSTLDELRLEVQTVAKSYHGTAALMGLNIVVDFEKVDTRGAVLLYVSADREGPFGLIADDSAYNLPLTYQGVGFAWDDSPYGDAMYMEFTGEAPMTTTLDHALGAGDFTLEFWVRPRAGEPLCTEDSVYLQLGIGYMDHCLSISRQWGSDPHQLQVTLAPMGSVTEVFAAGAQTTLPNDIWTHVALVRKSDIWSLFLAGRRIGTAQTTDPVDLELTEVFIGGADSNRDSAIPNFAGHLDDVRISVEARYDADFDPLTATRT